MSRNNETREIRKFVLDMKRRTFTFTIDRGVNVTFNCQLWKLDWERREEGEGEERENRLIYFSEAGRKKRGIIFPPAKFLQRYNGSWGTKAFESPRVIAAGVGTGSLF